MESNQTYLNKADLAITNLTAGGLLVVEQAKTFFEIVITESKLLPLVTTVPMNGPTYEIPKIGFSSRVLRRATENSGLGVADRVKPDFDKVTLTTKEYIAEARIPYGVVEDNIERDSFPQVAMNLLGKAVARDMEQVVILGDTLSADTLYSTQDGILKLATTSVVNAGGVRLSKTPLKTMVQTMPSQYRSQRLAFITSPNAVVDYVDSLSNRQTALGDDALAKASRAEYNGYPIVDVPLFPENVGTNSNKTNVLLLDPKNIHVGFQRQVRVETARDISSRQFIIVATVRFAVAYAHEPALVKATEVLAVAG